MPIFHLALTSTFPSLLQPSLPWLLIALLRALLTACAPYHCTYCLYWRTEFISCDHCNKRRKRMSLRAAGWLQWRGKESHGNRENCLPAEFVSWNLNPNISPANILWRSYLEMHYVLVRKIFKVHVSSFSILSLKMAEAMNWTWVKWQVIHGCFVKEFWRKILSVKDAENDTKRCLFHR